MVHGARTLYHNGRIHTMDPLRPRATAMVVQGDRILAVGDRAEVAGLLRAGDRACDLGGATMVPGFTDAHVHFALYSFLLSDINLDGVQSRAEALRRVAERAAQLPPGAWVRGGGFNANEWDRWPTAADLDRVAPQHPVALDSKDVHTTWCNSVAMRLAGVSAATSDPVDGRMWRDEHGEPTGLFQEGACNLIAAAMPERTPDEYEQAMRQGIRHAHTMGVTGVHCMDPIPAFQAMQRLHRSGELGVRVLKYLPVSVLDSVRAAGLQSGLGDAWLRIGGIKMFADGSLGSQTAAMLAPYEGAAGNLGVRMYQAEELAERVARCVEGNLAVAVHAIGDWANRIVLDALAAQHAAQRATSQRPGLRHRIEHVQLIDPADLPRVAQLGVVASVQPSHAPSDRYMADRLWGERSRHAYAFRSLLASGACLALGSDVPVEPLDPLAGIHAAVTRKRLTEPDSAPWYPEQRLTVDEAVAGFTMGAAYISGEERLKGSLSPGKLADFVVLSQDVFSGREEELATAHVNLTAIGGQHVYGQIDTVPV